MPPRVAFVSESVRIRRRRTGWRPLRGFQIVGDFIPWAWHKLGLRTIVHGVAIQPGKPLFAAVPDNPEDPEHIGNKLVIGLPGNPVSVLCTAHLFVWPLVRRMLGMGNALPWRLVSSANSVSCKSKRQIFRAARLLPENQVEVLGWHGSGDLMHTAQADGWVRLPLQDQPIEPGTTLPFLPIAGS